MNKIIIINKPILSYFNWIRCGILTDKHKEYLSQSGNILSLSSIITITRIAGGCILEKDIIEFIDNNREKYNKSYIEYTLKNIEYEHSTLKKIQYKNQIWYVLPYLMNEKGRKMYGTKI